VALPLLVSVAGRSSLPVPTTWLPKLSGLGNSEATGAGGATPVPMSVMNGESLGVLRTSVTLRVAEKGVAEVGVNVT